MGWIYADDILSGDPQYFGTLESAIEHCIDHGISYKVKYPRRRFHVKKDYADNFKWKGPENNEPEEY